jgi:hypothetical protein
MISIVLIRNLVGLFPAIACFLRLARKSLL